MQNLAIRPLDIGGDLEWLAGLGNQWRSEPISCAYLQEWLEHKGPGRVCRLAVALTAQGERAGYSECIHETWDPAGQFSLWVQVDPRYAGQGIGARLYAEGLACAYQQGAACLTSEVKDDAPTSLEFAARRGFSIDRHIFESVLDLDAFRFTPELLALEEGLAGKLRIVSLADLGYTLEARRQLYAINRDTALDIPGREENFLPYEEFEQLVMGADWFNPAGQFLASFDGQWAGMAAVRLIPATRGAYNLMTGVLPEFRGRKIAQALKLHAIRYAQTHGALTMRTNNDSLNMPMLAINRKLGYLPRPGIFKLRANIS